MLQVFWLQQSVAPAAGLQRKASTSITGCRWSDLRHGTVPGKVEGTELLVASPASEGVMYGWHIFAAEGLGCVLI